MDELFSKILGKIFAPIFALLLPIFAIFGNFNATGNYWWDLLIAFGISGTLCFFIILWIKSIRK